MALKFKLDSLDGVDPAHKVDYVQNEDDKKFYLQVEGVVSSDKLAEFRDNNISLSKKLEEYDGVDPKKYRDLVKMEADGKFNGKTNEEIDQIIAERVGTMRTEYETTIDKLNKAVGVQGDQLSLLLVDNVVRDAANKNGVTGPAVDDILLRAKSVFKLVDGKPIPHDDRGNVIYGTDGTNPLSVVNWVGGLKKTASHLFPQSQGSGAAGGRPGLPNNDKLTSNQKIAQGLADRAN
jgi:hypothetical protein